MPANNISVPAAHKAAFPALFFGAALAVSAVSFFLIISHSRSINSATGDLHDRHYKMLGSASSLVLLDSRLTLAANSAVSTGEPGYGLEHDRLSRELDGVIKNIGRLAVSQEDSRQAGAINEANLHLMETERRAIRLAGSGKRREAAALLGGADYINWEKIYARGVSGLLRNFEDSLRVESAASRLNIVKKGVASVIGVSLSLLFWALTLVSARNWLKNRGRTDVLVAQKEEEFRHFFDTVQEVFYRADWKGRLTDITPSIYKYSGYTREELLGRPVSNLYQDPESRRALLRELVVKGMVENYEVRLKTKDKGVLDILVNARLLRGVAGLPEGVEGSLRDITVRKAAEDKLRRLNRIYTILRLVNEAVAHVRTPRKLYEEVCRIAVENGGLRFAWVGLPGPDGVILPVASSGEGGGYLENLRVSTDPDQPEGRGPSGTAAREGRVVINSDTENNVYMLPWRDAALKRGFRSSAVFPIGGGGIVSFYAGETNVFTSDEEALLVSLSEDITYAVNSMRSEAARAETSSQLESAREQLRQSQKMEAVVRLAGGVANDFDHTLADILGHAARLESSLDPADPRRGEVRQITSAAERAAGLTRQLLAISRRQALRPSVLDLNDLLRGMEAELRLLSGESVELRLRLCADAARIKADPAQLEHAMRSLAVNSREAIAGAGKILIETDRITLIQPEPGRHDLVPPGRYIRLVLSDTGRGMEEAALAHIFEPFFGDGERSDGTGLGLPTVYGTIKQSGGYIQAYSDPGAGTSFRLYFPEVDGDPHAPAEGKDNPDMTKK
jgi:PAS domain S-box-containing protein